VIAIIKETSAIPAEQLTVLLSKSERTVGVRRYLDTLQKKKVIHLIGSKINENWKILRGDE